MDRLHKRKEVHPQKIKQSRFSSSSTAAAASSSKTVPLKQSAFTADFDDDDDDDMHLSPPPPVKRRKKGKSSVLISGVTSEAIHAPAPSASVNDFVVQVVKDKGAARERQTERTSPSSRKRIKDHHQLKGRYPAPRTYTSRRR